MSGAAKVARTASRAVRSFTSSSKAASGGHVRLGIGREMLNLSRGGVTVVQPLPVPCAARARLRPCPLYVQPARRESSEGGRVCVTSGCSALYNVAIGAVVSL